MRYWILWRKFLRFFSSPLFLYSLLASFLGLSLSRIGVAIGSYFLLSAFSEEGSFFQGRRDFSSSPVERKENLIREPLSSLIGGYFFSPPIEEAPTSQEEKPASLPSLELIGTVSGHPSFARAVIRVKGSKEPVREYKIGDNIEGAKLIAIGREYVVLLFQKERYTLRVGEELKKKEKPSQASLKKEEPKGGSSSQKIVKVLSRSQLNKEILGNLNKIYQGAAFGPYIVGGKVKGYKIYKIRPNHIFAKLGAKPGDIITKVNGFPLSTDPEKMFELYNSLRTAPKVSIEVNRGGKTYLYEFHIRE